MAARIAGVTIPAEKQVQIALTYVYGIGPKFAGEILNKAKIDPTVRVKNLTDAEVSKISEVIADGYTVEGELQRIVTGNIKRLKDIKAYRGERHSRNLPSKGQRTKTNARTRRGKKTTVGGTAKKVAAKT
jgi:small subunit ribosomal protein S13